MFPRRYPIGPEVVPGGVHFRVWAPNRREVEVLITAGPGSPARITLDRESDGYFSGLSSAAGPGSRCRFRLDGDGGPGLPDPASRYQPEGPHGDSQVIDHGFPWTD